jgi:hypothetical protein
VSAFLLHTLAWLGIWAVAAVLVYATWENLTRPRPRRAPLDSERTRPTDDLYVWWDDQRTTESVGGR